MARGQQKIQSQQKAQEKLAKMKKGGASHIGTTAAALRHSCAVCKSQMPDVKTYKQHFENKHPGKELPAELKDVQ